MNPGEILLRPIVTEKSTGLEALNQYTFQVHPKANKIEIRKAVEMAFGVRVTKVRTMVVRRRAKRVGMFRGRTAGWKKAIVTVHPNDAIDLYGEE